MNVLKNIFKAKLNNVFGMIHVKPLPGKNCIIVTTVKGKKCSVEIDFLIFK